MKFFNLNMGGWLDEGAIDDVLKLWDGHGVEKDEQGFYQPSSEVAGSTGYALRYLAYAKNARTVGGSLLVIREEECSLVSSGEFIGIEQGELLQGETGVAFVPGNEPLSLSSASGQRLADAVVGMYNTTKGYNEQYPNTDGRKGLPFQFAISGTITKENVGAILRFYTGPEMAMTDDDDTLYNVPTSLDGEYKDIDVYLAHAANARTIGGHLGIINEGGCTLVASDDVIGLEHTVMLDESSSIAFVPKSKGNYSLEMGQQLVDAVAGQLALEINQNNAKEESDTSG